MVKLSLCLAKYHAMKTFWVSGGMAPRVPNLCARWRLVVSYRSRPLYPRYPVDKILGGASEPVWTQWQGEESLVPARNRTRFINPVASSLY